MKARVLSLVAVTIVLLFALHSGAYSQEKGYPNKGITITIPTVPGGGIDFINRLVADYLKKEWKVSVDVMNKPAAGGSIALEEVARAKKDGYTLFGGLVSTPGTLTRVNPDGPVNLFRDFTPIACFRQHNINLLSVRSDSEFKSAQDVLNYIRKNPGKLICASVAVGQDPYLEIVLLKRLEKLDMVQLAFSNTSETVNTLLGGHAQLANIPWTPAAPLVEAGKLRGLAFNFRPFLPTMPKLPTFADVGLGQVSMHSAVTLLGPKGLPQEIVATWEKSLKALAQNAQFIASLNKAGIQYDLRTGTEELTAFMKQVVEQYSRFSLDELGWAKK